MNQALIIAVVVILVFMMCGVNSEHFYFRAPPLAYDAQNCSRLCDNTTGCNSYYYNPVTRQCWQNSFYRYGEIYYPYTNNTNFFVPARYKWGKYFGDIKGSYRPYLMQDQK
jgi:hypothetical protein